MSTMDSIAADLVAARDAYDHRLWDVARARFEAAARDTPLVADDLYALSNCAWWLGDLGAALPIQRSAYEEYREAGRTGPAAMVAVDIGYTLALRGDEAQASGWISRAQRLVRGMPDCPEHGYIGYLEFEDAFGRYDLDAAFGAARTVQEIGERHRDPALVALGVLGQGCVLVRQGRVDAGMAMLDEAMVAATSDSMDPAWAGTIYCHLMDACHEIADLRRANEWTRATAQWCELMPGAGPFMGICRVHRAQVLYAQGSWDAAEQEATRVRDEVSHFSMATVAEAHYLLGELRRQRGDLSGAETSYQAARTLGRDPQPGLALLRLAEGKPEAAAASIRSALVAAGDRPTARGHLLGAAVEIAVATRDLDRAWEAASELTRIAARYVPVGFTADALHAQGLVHLARGDAEHALPPLRDALRHWDEDGGYYQAARTREALADAYAALGDDDTAAFERSAARTALDRLRTTRSRPAARPAGLTTREVEVLALVAAGRTNQQIAHELVLSIRTVERHLASIYQKLGIGGRTARVAAVSFALREGIVDAG